jgi:hypothetical protein
MNEGIPWDSIRFPHKNWASFFSDTIPTYSTIPTIPTIPISYLSNSSWRNSAPSVLAAAVWTAEAAPSSLRLRDALGHGALAALALEMSKYQRLPKIQGFEGSSNKTPLMNLCQIYLIV